MAKGVIFDFDGTLVDSLGVTERAFNAGIVSQGGKPHTWEELSRYFGTGEDRIFAQILGEEKAAEAYSACRAYLSEHMHEVPLHAGIEALLSGLQERQIPVAIFTGRSWSTTELILKHHGWTDRFVTVVANDHVAKPKPAPLGIELALSRMNLQASEVLYVGDSDVDLLAARAAGCCGVAAFWDSRVRRTALQALRPDHIAYHPEALLDWL